jgi:hypothetical protein
MEILKDQNIVEILGCVHRGMMPYYTYYADQKHSLMNFDGFSKFCTDFEIFPDILSKPKIMRFFKTLSGFFETTTKQITGDASMSMRSSGRPKSPGADITGASERMRRDVIDEHLFVEALALTAFEINYTEPSPSNAEKVSDPIF